MFLLPPSEGKTEPSSGPRLSLSTLPFPTLTPTRKTILRELIDLSKKNPEQAAKVLDLGPTQTELLRLNSRLRSAASAPAIEVYSGVLFDHIDYPSLNESARARFNEHVLISSALFGFLTPQAPIPAYRLSGNSVIPSVGSLTSLWKKPLRAFLDSLPVNLIVDLRSGSYAKLAPLPADNRNVTIKVMTLVNGVRKSVTHFNKATKGDLVRLACTDTTPWPQSIEDLAPYFRALGYHADLHVRKNNHHEIEILTT